MKVYRPFIQCIIFITLLYTVTRVIISNRADYFGLDFWFWLGLFRADPLFLADLYTPAYLCWVQSHIAISSAAWLNSLAVFSLALSYSAGTIDGSLVMRLRLGRDGELWWHWRMTRRLFKTKPWGTNWETAMILCFSAFFEFWGCHSISRYLRTWTALCR